jgi:hyaluronoglucosaminidase
MTFAIRGIIEGFYDRLWTWEERTRIVDAIAGRGFTTYVYAPKEDRSQNAGWRSPYPQGHRDALRTFAHRCSDAGLQPWLGLRPMGFDYSTPADAERLVAKLTDHLELGAGRLVLLADDIPDELEAATAGRFTSLADAHAWLVDHVLERLGLPPADLVVVPTHYAGAGTPYLADLAARVPPETDICWTGPDVCSRAIRTADAAAIAEILGRPALVWDNYPVNDDGMTDQLHIGPIRHRAPDLDAEVRGILVNPALQPEATIVPLLTWADYLADPAGYDPDASWQRALLEVTGDLADADAVAVLAAARDRSAIRQGWDAPDAARLAAALERVEALGNRALREDLVAFAR